MSAAIDIDIRALEQVSERLDEALKAYAETPENLFILDSVIKRFELSYMQSIRLIERYLSDYAPISPETDAPFRELIEKATENGITQTPWADWLEFRKARNKTAHTYLEDAIRLLTVPAAKFLPVARFVLESVKRRAKSDAGTT